MPKSGKTLKTAASQPRGLRGLLGRSGTQPTQDPNLTDEQAAALTTSQVANQIAELDGVADVIHPNSFRGDVYGAVFTDEGDMTYEVINAINNTLGVTRDYTHSDFSDPGLPVYSFGIDPRIRRDF